LFSNNILETPNWVAPANNPPYLFVAATQATELSPGMLFTQQLINQKDSWKQLTTS
jgi:hypothetical protein